MKALDQLVGRESGSRIPRRATEPLITVKRSLCRLITPLTTLRTGIPHNVLPNISFASFLFSRSSENTDETIIYFAFTASIPVHIIDEHREYIFQCKDNNEMSLARQPCFQHRTVLLLPSGSVPSVECNPSLVPKPPFLRHNACTAQGNTTISSIWACLWNSFRPSSQRERERPGDQFWERVQEFKRRVLITPGMLGAA
jgi:hypothetical protein